MSGVILLKTFEFTTETHLIPVLLKGYTHFCPSPCMPVASCYKCHRIWTTDVIGFGFSVSLSYFRCLEFQFV